MLYTTVCVALWLAVGGSVAALFFCNVAMAPLVARRMLHLGARRRPEVDARGRRLVRFW